jgi:hypothetical protein
MGYLWSEVTDIERIEGFLIAISEILDKRVLTLLEWLFDNNFNTPVFGPAFPGLVAGLGMCVCKTSDHQPARAAVNNWSKFGWRLPLHAQLTNPS